MAKTANSRLTASRDMSLKWNGKQRRTESAVEVRCDTETSNKDAADRHWEQDRGFDELTGGGVALSWPRWKIRNRLLSLDSGTTFSIGPITDSTDLQMSSNYRGWKYDI